MPSLPKVIVFDIDGVLLELTDAETGSFVGAFARSFGIGEIDRDWNTYKRRNDIGIAKEILERHFGRPATARELDVVRDDYLDALGSGLRSGRIVPEVLPGVHETLPDLADQKDLCLALATANLGAAAKIRLTRADLWRYFHCGGYAESGEDKTAILAAVIVESGRHLGSPVAPDEVLFLGDQPSDARAAQTNGTRFIGVAADDRRHEALATAGATHIVTSISRDLFRSMGMMEH